MDSAIIVAIVSGAFTLVGTFLGIITSTKLSNYRIDQLEEKVEKHNQVIDRVYHLEQRDAVVDEDLKTIDRRINDLEVYHK